MDKDYTPRNENNNLTNEILDNTIDVVETNASVNELPSDTTEKIMKLKETVAECTSNEEVIWEIRYLM